MLEYIRNFAKRTPVPAPGRPYFMRDFYLRQNPDVAKAGVDPLTHYRTFGWREGRQPSPYFSPAWYVARYPDVAAAEVEPLEHYVRFGQKEKRQPHYLIDIDYYLSGAPDVAAAHVNPFLHFFENGDAEGRSPHPLFDPAYYRANGPDIGALPPFAHYAEFGVRQNRSPCPAFDPKHYKSVYPHDGEDALLRYLLAAPRDRPHFHPLIDGNYQMMTSERAARAANPLFDYMLFRCHMAPTDVARGRTSIPSPARAFVAGRCERRGETDPGPKVSIVTPCYMSNLVDLESCVLSIFAQTYANWELVLVDDGSRGEATWDALKNFCARDRRVKALRLDRNRNISEATNAGVTVTEGEFVAFVDHDDALTPNALATMIAAVLAKGADAAYSDQAFVNTDNVVEEPNFKPDWSPALFCGVMYVGHLLIVRKAVALEAGLFRSKFDGCQDFEFMLRVGDLTKKIIHVPHVLYHWRRSENSVATNSNAKGKIEPKQASAVTEHFARIGFNGECVIDDRVPHRLRMRPRRRMAKTTLDIVVQGGRRGAPGKFDPCGIEKLGRINTVTLCDWNRSPSLCVSEGDAPWVLFVDPRISFIDNAWLEHRLMYAECDDVAFVASHLFDKCGRVVSAGLTASPRGLLDVYRGFCEGQDGAWGTLFCDREVIALGGSCTLVSRSQLVKIGGLSPISVSCDGAVREASYRASLAGLRNISIAARLVEYDDAANQDLLPAAIDRQFFLDSHKSKLVLGDPYYNLNCSPEKTDFTSC